MAYLTAFARLLVAALVISGSAAAAGHPDTTDVQFILAQQLSYGQGFVITGNLTDLGSWTPTSAPLMSVTASGTSAYWLLTVSIEEGTYFEYKPVRVVYDTKVALEWYNAGNLNVTVPSSTCPTQVFIVWDGSSADASLSSAAATIAGLV